MAANNIQGGRTINRALERLAQNEEQLEHGLAPFDQPPPYSNSHPRTHNSTLLQSPNFASDQYRRLLQLSPEQRTAHVASTPYHQHLAQVMEETEWLFKGSIDGTRPLPLRVDVRGIAEENVKHRWVEQGIWDDEWTTLSGVLWKHENLEESESEDETAVGANFQGRREPLFPGFGSTPRHTRTDEERQIKERRERRKRDREASRPYRQFDYQLLQQRRRIETDTGVTADINTIAYEAVKAIWVRRKIWNHRWGIIPGLSWKHEDPIEDEPLEDRPLASSSGTMAAVQ